MSVPILEFGKYKGKSLDAVPMSYLRWILGQQFEPAIMEFAKKKLERNKSFDGDIEVTRHAIDSFSLRYLYKWDGKKGLASFIALKASEALKNGVDVSKNRHQDENRIIEHEDIKYVFNKDSGLNVLITIM